MSVLLCCVFVCFSSGCMSLCFSAFFLILIICWFGCSSVLLILLFFVFFFIFLFVLVLFCVCFAKVCAALAGFQGDLGVQYMGCGAVGNLSNSNTQVREICNGCSGGIIQHTIYYALRRLAKRQDIGSEQLFGAHC